MLPCETVKRQPHACVSYMTGTGNTARAAGVIAGEFRQAGWIVRSAELRRGVAVPGETRDDDLLVLCFPTLGFGLPALVRTLLKGLKGRGRRAAVFSTWGGEGSAGLLQARVLLWRKGFRVIAAGGATYPFQWTEVCPPSIKGGVEPRVERGDAEVRKFAKALLTGLATKRGAHAAAGFWARAGATFRAILGVALCLPISWTYTYIGRYGLGAMFAADERCTACGNCARDCPAGAIVMTGAGPARRPRWGRQCEGCNRCINLCPREAVQASPTRSAVHTLLNAALIAAVVVGLNRAAVALSVPGPAGVLAYAAALIALVVFGSRLQFAGLERPLFALESIPAVRRTIGRSWTARFPRYRCPGFRPARDEKVPIS